MGTRFGSNVYKNLCEQESTKSKAIAALKEAVPMLQKSTHGRKLVKQVLDSEAPRESVIEWPELQSKEADPKKSIETTQSHRFL